jgi:hypothetical protein
MQPEEHPDPTRPPPSHNTGADSAGGCLIISGMFCGGAWTLIMYLGESIGGGTHWRGVPLATILTLVGTIAWIAAGVLMIVNARGSGKQTTAEDTRLAIPILLLGLTAVSGYFFGFLVCIER